MASSKAEIKNRIKTVSSIQKITKAMKLVASAKLAKQKNKMEETKVYSTYLLDVLSTILSDKSCENHPFVAQQEGKTLCLVITSDMGLCGGYNSNIYRYLNQKEKDSDIIMLGQRGSGWIKSSGFTLLDSYANLKDDCFDELALLMKEIVEQYQSKKYGKVELVYTKFINSVSFEVDMLQLLPIVKKPSEQQAKMEFEPSQTEILNHLVPMYINAIIYSCYLESKTSEHASRRSAMETATDNALELQEKLSLQYNQARQAAITQEISEIVSGADAL